MSIADTRQAQVALSGNRGCAVPGCQLARAGVINDVPLCPGHTAALRGRLVRLGIDAAHFSGDILQLLTIEDHATAGAPTPVLTAALIEKMRARLKPDPEPALSVLVLCECRHSPGAHSRLTGQRCSFCFCGEFRAWIEPVPADHQPLPGDVVEALTKLAHEPAFNDLPLEHLAALGRVGRRRFFPRGMILTDIGDRSGQLYLLLSGGVQAERPIRGGVSGQTTRLGPGEIVGAISMLRGTQRTVTIRALEDTVTLELLKPDLEDIFHQDAQLHEAFLSMVSSRLNTAGSPN